MLVVPGRIKVFFEHLGSYAPQNMAHNLKHAMCALRVAVSSWAVAELVLLFAYKGPPMPDLYCFAFVFEGMLTVFAAMTVLGLACCDSDRCRAPCCSFPEDYQLDAFTVYLMIGWLLGHKGRLLNMTSPWCRSYRHPLAAP